MMTLVVLAFLGGVLTIASPCILPVVPLVMTRTGRSLARDILPMLAGMAITFAAAASIATASAAWLVRASIVGHWIALALLAVVGASLLFPRVADALAALPVRLGARLDRAAGSLAPGVAGNAVIGAAVALLWAPCAGPILGLVVAIAAADGWSARSASLYLAFAAGAAASLAVVLFAGGRLLERLRRGAGVDRWVRRALGAAALAVVVLLASGRDSAVFARAGVSTAPAEARLVALVHGGGTSRSSRPGAGSSVVVRPAPLPSLTVQGSFPGFAGGGPWINSTALTPASLRGKVVMIDFWTFLCDNCLNALPHVEALAKKYHDRGLVVVGVHTPEFLAEHDEASVRDEVKRLGIVYPVVMDNTYAIWRAFNNQYWPAAFFIDKAGKIRYHHFGEGAYDTQDRVVAQLLSEPAP
ncbi:MAG TPA: cytochrome c biogenesis protein CcdA [Gemmatimonadaceae bacterium]|nr:cytochrome c biogenesis protein CcdA [Gemmatimonadaceae bacterium]